MAEIKEIIENFKIKANEHVQKHAFPSFEEVDKNIVQVLEKSVHNRKALFVMYSEFGPTTYLCMKAIYENLTNEEYIRNIGKSLNEQGGFTTMHSVYYLICNFTPISNFEFKKWWLSNLNETWDGIGTWIGK